MIGVEDLRSLVLSARPTGSRFICDPAPTDTDEDWVVLVHNRGGFEEIAKILGYEIEYQGAYTDLGFDSYRRGEINLIVTDDVNFFSDFWAATLVAKHLNLTAKNSREELFSSILCMGAFW